MLLVLSFSLAASIHWLVQSYSEATNATTTMLILLLLYQFWLAEIYICHKPRPTRDETRDLQIALPRTLMFPFFFLFFLYFRYSTHKTRSFWTLRLAISLVTSCFFLSSFWCCYERNSFLTASLSHFISLVCPAHHLFFFYSAGDGLLDSRKRRLFCCIYSMSLVVSLNYEPRLDHQRKQSAGYAFQFQYRYALSKVYDNYSDLSFSYYG